MTGHGLRIAGMHRRSVERFDFDSVLLPYNFSLLGHDGYRADFEALRSTCAERRIAVQTIKAVARRRWRDGDGSPRHSWYEPLADVDAVGRAVRWVLSQPDLFLNSSSDGRLLRPILEAAATIDAMAAPSESELMRDMDTFGIEPLFDGAALERI